MKKQFKEFKAFVPTNIVGLMTQYWMSDENITRDEALDRYITGDFREFTSTIANTFQTFTPDLGYRNKETNGTLCFLKGDNNWVIPVEVLESV